MITLTNLNNPKSKTVLKIPSNMITNMIATITYVFLGLTYHKTMGNYDRRSKRGVAAV